MRTADSTLHKFAPTDFLPFLREVPEGFGVSSVERAKGSFHQKPHSPPQLPFPAITARHPASGVPHRTKIDGKRTSELRNRTSEAR